ncbi:sterol desaturase family protein [Paraflavitalea sp. CAU 1676]|uniref:sterol desaturase family protein n=1 Tax=Paraflavitalea sp. CAU 1676 TaxID=3032598 RepID=UPI0023DBA758|nr:sterol desaturase family protein [Paraflavitalea sp. CAU 1676]MDF2189479.1 sterol desaturase family protein [Paraflavitalea sp. CAU 1676]
MNLNILAFAVPLFVSFMVLEYVVARRKKLPYFNLHHSIANISVGIAERLMDVWVVGIFYFVYDHIQKHYGLFEIKPNLLLWILLLLCTDFLWYWYHRLAHEINIFWAAHIVHHQSEDFNYTVSARITVLQAFIRTGFWAVLPFLGFPASMITSILLVHGLYPFFIHTRLIGKLGILEYVFVTPSHHRVHHASNEQYLDKNYGDVFIIWDKLFGTFQKEEDDVEIKYGLTHPLKSYSFLWQHFHFLAELTYAVRRTPGRWNKLKLLFSRPDQVDPAVREIAEARFRIRQSNAPFDKPLNRYVVWQIGLTIGLLFIFILFEHYIPVTQQVLISLAILLTLINCGAIMEQKQWIYYLEFLRLLTLTIGFIMVYPAVWLNILLLFAAILLVAYFDTIRVYYLEWVYHRHRRS